MESDRVKSGRLSRRDAMCGIAAAGAAASFGAAKRDILDKPLADGSRIPAIGMGTWLTFDVGEDAHAQRARRAVLQTFFGMGGRVVDSSPMYGSSQAVVGASLQNIPGAPVFAADKVWTRGRAAGRAQIEASRQLWGVARFDLLQVHNLVDWEVQIETLLQMKAEGRVRYVGVTSYAGLRYDEIAAIMESRPLDFVQITYNIFDREAEARILPVAGEKGVAVIANRPFREGALIDHFAGKPLPGVAGEIGAANWPQFLLKFIISHPAVTVAIPATRRVDHMRENMAALTGPVPDETLRVRMAAAAAEI